ncbi:MAG: 5-formyltetrahydrofolate cyclo-ligase [Pseudomonadota bacterium]
MPVSESKSLVRARALARRSELSPADRDASALGLVKHSAWHVEGKVVGGYHAIGHEIDPLPLLDRFNAAGAILCLPVLLDQTTMVFRRWNPARPLVPVGFGTLGPDETQAQCIPQILLMPLVAFSASGNRIGYGKGHYDRAIAKFRQNGADPVRVGIAYACQEVADIVNEPHDVPLDGILTPDGLIICPAGETRLAPFISDSGGR